MTTVDRLLNTSIEDTLRMQEYVPRLYKITAMCDNEKNRVRGSVGGIKKSYKLLIPDDKTYQDIVVDSSILLDIIHKEYPNLQCRLTSVERIRDIPISLSLVDMSNPSKLNTTAKATNELLNLVYNSHVEDPVIIIRSHDVTNSQCKYAIINADGLHIDCI